MSDVSETFAPEVDGLKAAADGAIAATGGDAREAVKALIVASNFFEGQLAKMRAAVSTGYAHGRFDPPQDRKEGADVQSDLLGLGFDPAYRRACLMRS